MSTATLLEAIARAQGDASDPQASVFVAANAGSGKTHVLTQRVVRLLLSGIAPSRVLCLTYTKAAAAEMQGRVFSTLSRWTTMDDGELSAALAALGRPDASADDLAQARQLFARALETPGGLKIQTIHAFCEAILHQFPIEADVPGRFAVMEDAESRLLIAEARRMLVRGSRPGAVGDSALADGFAEALASGGEAGLDRLIDEIVAKRDRVKAHLAEAGGLEGAVRRLAGALGVDPSGSEDEALAALWPCPHLTPGDVAALGETAGGEGAGETDRKLAERLGRFADAALSLPERLAAYRELVLDSKGEPRASIRGFATKAVAAAAPGIADRLPAAGERALAFLDRLASLRLFAASRAALAIAERLERDYASLKRRRGRLDFEDLVVRTADLLTRSEAAAWVHYKLDQGIDHVLVDEAQDTSPRQWQVVRSLVEEFFAGGPDGETRHRTVFAVGDEKQSIYSFQGASPAMFDAERRAVEARAKGARTPFRRIALQQSFRSAPGILRAVDLVFAAEEDRRGLSAENLAPVHVSARVGAPSLVEVWPFLRAESARASDHWLDPIDHEPRSSPANRLATRIAEQIKRWIGTPIETRKGTRALTPGDFIVLVRKRTGFVAAMGAALRERGIRVAGADRLVITDHIAVQDLIALGRVVANAEDELSLAALLKSPLFGFSDDELMAFALARDPERPVALLLALREIASGALALPPFVAAGSHAPLRARLAQAIERIERLRERAGFEGVFTFFARLLGPEGGRAALAARLGRDSDEVVDAFLDLALAQEAEGRSGLDAFLADLEADPPTVKREMDHARGEVRIMTTHASKGLEAPVVFLVDPGSKPFVHTHGSRLIEWEGMPGLAPGARPGWLWCPEKGLANRAVDALRAAEALRAEDEYRRLLYVGLTRAADRLVVCGFCGVRGPDGQSWLTRVEAALKTEAEAVPGGEAGEVLAWRLGAAPAERLAPAVAADAEPAFPFDLSPFDLSPLAPEPVLPPPLAPSAAGFHAVDEEDEAAMPASRSGGDRTAFAGALERGRVAHRLLQILPGLPADRRRDVAAALSASLREDERDALLQPVFRILEDPRFGALFAPGSRAEVALTGPVRIGGRQVLVNGTVDRLVVCTGEVLVVDYKTDRLVPEDAQAAPDAHLVQLALYRALLAPIYPDRPVRCALLYTAAPVLLPVAPALLAETLARRARGAGPA